MMDSIMVSITFFAVVCIVMVFFIYMFFSLLFDKKIRANSLLCDENGKPSSTRLLQYIFILLDALHLVLTHHNWNSLDTNYKTALAATMFIVFTIGAIAPTKVITLVNKIVSVFTKRKDG